MNRRQIIHLLLGLILVLLLAGCAAATTTLVVQPSSTPPVPTYTQPPPATPTPLPTRAASDTPVPTPSSPRHSIAIRYTEGVGEFYFVYTGGKFTPRGSNYIRLANQLSPSGDQFFYHSTFNTNLYDPEQVEAALARMQSQGYNAVRVFLQGSCKDYCLGDPAGGLLDGYVANVADFLHRAKSHHIYVILTIDGEPGTAYYNRLLDTTWSEDFGGTNKHYLTGGGVLVARQFWQDLIDELIQQGAPLEVIFAYQLRNELFFESDAPPLSYTSRTFRTANGKTYDMASPGDRQRMRDENLLYWIEQVRSSILERDPSALVTVGFFVPQGPNPARIGDNRLVDTRSVIWESSLDFIDLHPYPGFGFSLAQYVENFGMQGMLLKPILMGEFGVSCSSYTSEVETAFALRDWQVESCQYGFDGWLMWTWDTDEQVDFYNALTGAGNINLALAPVTRPDPCLPGEFELVEHNLALGAHAEASRSILTQPPSGAVDGTLSMWWGAGDFAPQWILVDLGTPQEVGKIRLVITQYPDGETFHQVWAGATIDTISLVHTFEGSTVDGQVLEFIPETPLENIRYVRINTRQSPSWVGWQEIEIMAP